MRFPVNHSRFYALPLAALVLLGGCGGGGDYLPVALTPASTTGPSADYPMVLGDPFTIGSVTWTPSDQLNYDAVGPASVGGEDLVGITAAHKTLPLPSYAEVTSLDTGKTILIRVEKRGPMDNETLLQLSPAAAAQLGVAGGGRAPVRVRRVNPPEVERSALRQGNTVPERMETPESLLKVLRRKLAEQSPLLPTRSLPPAMVRVDDEASLPAVVAKPAPPPAAVPARDLPKPVAPKPATAPTPSPQPANPAVATKGSIVVQVAAFAVETNARKAAAQLGGSTAKSGKYWRVHLGPFSSRAQAGPALEKAKAAGYRDARIQQAD